MSPQQPHDDTAEVAARLRMAIARLARFLRHQDQGELPATFTSALATIAKEGPMTLGEVAARERIAPPSVTKVVERLLGMELVERRVDPTDRRVTLVSLTDAGRRQLDANRARRSEWLAAQLEQLDAPDVARLSEVLEVLEHLVEIAGSEHLPAGAPS